MVDSSTAVEEGKQESGEQTDLYFFVYIRSMLEIFCDDLLLYRVWY